MKQNSGVTSHMVTWFWEEDLSIIIQPLASAVFEYNAFCPPIPPILSTQLPARTRFLSHLTYVLCCFHLIIGVDLWRITASYCTCFFHTTQVVHRMPHLKQVNTWAEAGGLICSYLFIFKSQLSQGPCALQEGRERTGSGKSVLLFQTCLVSYTICVLIWVIKTRKLHPLLSVAPWITDCPTTIRFNGWPVTDKEFMEKLQWSSPFCRAPL